MSGFARCRAVHGNRWGRNTTVTPRTKKPKPPTDRIPRVVRGGSWDYSSASIVRAAFRIGDTPSNRDLDLGFRCAQRGARMPLKVTP